MSADQPVILVADPYLRHGSLKNCKLSLIGALDSGCHLRNHLLAGMKKAHLHGADRLKMGNRVGENSS